MPLNFSCPHCGAQTLVDDEFVGHGGECFTCGKQIVVPPTADASPLAVKKAASGKTLSRSTVAVIAALIVAGLVAGAGMLSLFIWLAVPVMNTARQATHRQSCATNMQQIAAAMQRYHDEHGTYPPAFVADANGKPLHSWRVLLLPYLGQQSLFAQIDLKQPWDAQQNRLLAQQMPAIYACPADFENRGADETSYMVLVGSNTMFPDAKTTKRTDLRDGRGQTILLVETTKSAVCWMDPQDIAVEGLKFELNGLGNSVMRSNHPGGVQVMMADGTVHFLDESASPENLEALSTIQGGEGVPLTEMLHGRR